MKMSSLRIAKRLEEVRFSDIVQIRNKVMALRAAGEAVYGFHGGEPFFATPLPIKYGMMQALVEDKTHYAPSSGMEPLREAIAQKLKSFNRMDVGPDKVLLTVGGSHALYAAFQCVPIPATMRWCFRHIGRRFATWSPCAGASNPGADGER